MPAGEVPVGIQTNAEGEEYVALAAKRRATAREFKGALIRDLLLDLRVTEPWCLPM